jgi:uncharacterized protein (UPF0276 family)
VYGFMHIRRVAKTEQWMAPSSVWPLVGIGYRAGIGSWIRANLHCFDVLEITVDHCLHGGEAQRREIFDLVGRIPLTAHGIGLSIGTDEPLDLAYLDEVAAVLDRLKAPAYSEHLAFTRVPGRDLANLLPLPRTEAVAEAIIAKIRTIQSRISVPVLLENIAFVFQWPDSTMSESEFLTLICRETGVGILLDIENLHLNAQNHGLDAHAFLDALPRGTVKEIHMAGGVAIAEPSLQRPFLADSHSHPVSDGAVALLEYALDRYLPDTIVIERDDRLDRPGEILEDVKRLRRVIGARKKAAKPRRRPQAVLLQRQIALLDYLTSHTQISGKATGTGSLPLPLQGINPALLALEARFSHEKRIEKIAAILPRTFERLGDTRAALLRSFAEAYPASSIDRIANARQFRDFLSACERGNDLPCAYLSDLAALEVALATVRTGRHDDGQLRDSDTPAKIDPDMKLVRRAPDVALLRCGHDIRAILETDSLAPPVRKDTPLVVAKAAGSATPVVFAVPAPIFALLARLDDWTAPPTSPETSAFFTELADCGVLEIAR